ncbi:ABC transporter ATP-binding protein [Clostridium chrysemydis]|uniref:ABC transporter ATP-binding protein n=1 Tax=Clostridium chrysemydis TaxID=2665504 RepID=UPI00188367BC|nr:ABC transporter ATP-binding protein [Clostridium chrysemydis]
MSLLKVSNINMSYHSEKSETKALSNISFNVENGDYLSILGPSGCGKSTLLNILSGLLVPSTGEIIFNGKDILKREEQIGYMFQKDGLFDWTSVWNNVTLGLKIKGELTERNKARVLKLLENYDLLKFKDHKPSELSGGMRQRVALIRTLALNPKVLFLDEPFSSLDYQTRLNVCDEIHQIIKLEKKTAIMVTHDIGEAISTSNRIIILKKRPGEIKREITLDFKESLTPFYRRKEKSYNDYFNIIWKELQDD